MLNTPKSLILDLPFSWEATLTDYQSDTYNLVIGIAGPDSIPVATTPNDDGSWLCEIDGADVVTVGTFAWAARVIDDSNLYKPVGTGTLKVVVDLVNSDIPYDGRSQAEQILDNIRAAILALTTGKPVQSYSIEGRSASYYSLSELVTLEDRYQRIVDREKSAEAIANGKPSTCIIRTRFAQQY
jgi:hypothetical protein